MINPQEVLIPEPLGMCSILTECWPVLYSEGKFLQQLGVPAGKVFTQLWPILPVREQRVWSAVVILPLWLTSDLCQRTVIKMYGFGENKRKKLSDGEAKFSSNWEIDSVLLHWKVFNNKKAVKWRIPPFTLLCC